MPKIAITELHSAGSAFFSESETFLDDLKDEDVLTQLSGGFVNTDSIFTDPDYPTILPTYPSLHSLFPEIPKDDFIPFCPH
jgi:hypothetical protein